MPDSDDSSSNSSANLPVPVTPEEPQGTRERADACAAHPRLGWQPGSMRANLEVILDSSASGDAGLSAGERTMLRNILALRERRISDLMVPRADIIAVRQDISLGELIRVFESASIRASSFMTRRSIIRRAWSTSAT